jgi:hypothetical protein
VEKYADIQPLNLLAKVAAGNDPGNFLFCLNKMDQVSAEEAGELREDFSGRIQRAVSLANRPRVFMISAKRQKEFDLPELVKLLSREKSADALAQSRELAARRRGRSLLDWLGRQDLPGRAAQLRRLDELASDILDQRVGVPLVEGIIPGMIDDPVYRMVMTDGVFARRVSRWPIVNVLHALLSPLRFVLRENAAAGSFFGGEEGLIEAHLKIGGGSIATPVQSAFAQLNQSDPAVAGLYAGKKFWEPMEASMAEGRLRQSLVETVRAQRGVALRKLSGRNGIIAPVVRVVLTIGALLWFPLVQPLLEAMLSGQSVFASSREAAVVFVKIFSAAYLLESAVFLLIWYLVIWGLLRWSTRRRVDRLLGRWKSADDREDSLNLTTRALGWIGELLEPIQRRRERMEELAKRVGELREELGEESRSAA